MDLLTDHPPNATPTEEGKATNESNNSQTFDIPIQDRTNTDDFGYPMQDDKMSEPAEIPHDVDPKDLVSAVDDDHEQQVKDVVAEAAAAAASAVADDNGEYSVGTQAWSEFYTYPVTH